MTRRDLKRSLGFALFALIATSPLGAEIPRFTHHTIAEVGQRMGQTSLVDIDRDGDLDWVVGQSGTMW